MSKTIKTTGLTPRYRLAVASRVLAAALGGYALTSAATLLLALLWPAPKAQGILWATMLSFALYAVAVIWVFHTKTAARAWLGMLVATAVCSGLAWMLWLGGRP
ncbi:iron transporter [Comamonas sp. JUb58]|uniref:iron transporter n=1 Tax=Comamonas sp. JUb58 TaxID=2485114 RepID=UPI00105BC9E7|nr:iron transporter [Comamonas sp. JUb58]TDS78793.1 hypothetical protein EDF71_111141 [Comamonas sp. JUb58]